MVINFNDEINILIYNKLMDLLELFKLHFLKIKQVIEII
jgi:hypothetical protein